MALLLKKSAPPSMWNTEMASGALIGTAITPIIGTAIGAYVGGAMGKARMEREYDVGKDVHNPTAWNKEAVLGSMLGLLGGSIAAIGTFFIGAAIGTMLGGPPTGIAAGYITAAATSLGGGIVGGLIGGASGKRDMEKDYQTALMLEQQRAMMQDVDKAKSNEYVLAQAEGKSATHFQEMVGAGRSNEPQVQR